MKCCALNLKGSNTFDFHFLKDFWHFAFRMLRAFLLQHTNLPRAQSSYQSRRLGIIPCYWTPKPTRWEVEDPAKWLFCLQGIVQLPKNLWYHRHPYQQPQQNQHSACLSPPDHTNQCYWGLCGIRLINTQSCKKKKKKKEHWQWVPVKTFHSRIRGTVK